MRLYCLYMLRPAHDMQVAYTALSDAQALLSAQRYSLFNSSTLQLLTPIGRWLLHPLGCSVDGAAGGSPSCALSFAYFSFSSAFSGIPCSRSWTRLSRLLGGC